MNKYLTSKYKEVEDVLKPFIEEHGLNEDDVFYLISKNVEIIEYQEPQEPQMPFIRHMVVIGDPTGVKSIKLKNIKVDFLYLLESVFTVKSLKGANLVWTFLGILKTILHFMQDMTIQLGKQEAIVLFALYRLQSATEKEIEAYIPQLEGNGEIKDVQDLNIQKALDKLEEINTIKLEDGEYSICETVFIKGYKCKTS